NGVRNHGVSEHETAYAGPQVFVATTADVRVTRQQREASGDRIDHAVRDVDAAASRRQGEALRDRAQRGALMPPSTGPESSRRHSSERRWRVTVTTPPIAFDASTLEMVRRYTLAGFFTQASAGRSTRRSR